MKKLRISEKELEIIRETAREVFGEGVEVYLFGSRTDPTKKGGDIDIFVKSERKIKVSDKLSFLAKLELKGIERKVDILTLDPLTTPKDIHLEAFEEGVKIL